MSQIKSVTAEISNAINLRVERGEIINLTLFTSEFVSSKSEIHGEDADFYRVCTFKVVQEVASSCIKKFSTKQAKTSADILLPGFERLQLAYPVMRNGSQMLVPVEFMSDGELVQRAEEYEGMARGCLDHASEIRAYIYARNASNDNIPAATEKVAA